MWPGWAGWPDPGVLVGLQAAGFQTAVFQKAVFHKAVFHKAVFHKAGLHKREYRMLSESEKTDARRYLGYPVLGGGALGNQGWQFYQAFGAMEWRLANLGDAEEAVLRQYLVTLATLEAAVPGVGVGLDTGSAAGWTRNPAELNERLRLFDDWRRRFAAFLGVPGGAALKQSGQSVGLVV